MPIKCFSLHKIAKELLKEETRIRRRQSTPQEEIDQVVEYKMKGKHYTTILQQVGKREPEMEQKTKKYSCMVPFLQHLTFNASSN